MLLNIFLTGAAGLVGGEIAARLVAKGHRVTALVHRTREIRGNDGAPVAVAQTLAGDIAQDRLGLAEGDHARLAAETDMVIHCAATVRFDLSEEDYARTNVQGTQRVIDLAREAGARLLHVSTAYVCGARDGAILETDPLPKTGFANGYEASKAAGERAVRASGLPFVIARPSIVTGHSETGAIRQFDTTYALFRLIAQGRIAHLPACPDASFDFAPIDHVAGGIVRLAERFSQAQGAAYHLVGDRPLPVTEFAAAIAAYSQFQPPELVTASSFDPGALPARERRLYARGVAPYEGYFARNPRFDDSRFRALTGMEPPQAGRAYLERLINYCIAQGFLPSGTEETRVPA